MDIVTVLNADLGYGMNRMAVSLLNSSVSFFPTGSTGISAYYEGRNLTLRADISVRDIPWTVS